MERTNEQLADALDDTRLPKQRAVLREAAHRLREMPEGVEWLSELSESDVAGCHQITNDKPTHPDYHYGFHLRHRQVVGPWMTYDDDDREVVAEDQSHRTCVSIDHCAARNAATPGGANEE